MEIMQAVKFCSLSYKLLWCACGTKYIYPAASSRMGYGSCWSHPPLETSQTCPQTTFPRKCKRGSAAKVGQPILLPPDSLPNYCCWVLFVRLQTVAVGHFCDGPPLLSTSIGYLTKAFALSAVRKKTGNPKADIIQIIMILRTRGN